MESLKTPYVSEEILEYLERIFHIDTLLPWLPEKGEEALGYIKGVRQVLTHLTMLHNESKEDSNVL